jgi:hypothetical protein
MRRFSGRICCSAVCIAMAFLATSAWGEHPAGHSLNSMGRWLGYGWSRGYHANDNVAPAMPGGMTVPGGMIVSEHPSEIHSSPVVESWSSPSATNLQPQPTKNSVLTPSHPLPAQKPTPGKVPEIKTPPLPTTPRATMPPMAEEPEQKGNMSRRVRNYFHRAERYPVHELR